MADTANDTDERAPEWLRSASDWSWRLVVVAIPIAAAVWLAWYLSIIVIPLVIAVFAAAILEPIRQFFLRYFSAVWAAAASFLVGLLLASTVFGLAVAEISRNFDDLVAQTETGLQRLTNALAESPLGIDADGIDKAISSGLDKFKSDPGAIMSGAASVASTTGGLLTGMLLALVACVFMMFDRRRIIEGLIAPFGNRHRDRRFAAVSAAWAALVAYVQVTIVEACFDSILIGAAAAIAGVPVAFALGAIVFLSVFVPTIGAIVSGALVTLVTLVTQGPLAALGVGVAVLIVQQVDANVLYPILTSRRLAIHPLASILLVAAGGIIGGIFGAFIAVPMAGMLIAGFRRWNSWEPPSAIPASLEPSP